jgi:hypothetical protein
MLHTLRSGPKVTQFLDNSSEQSNPIDETTKKVPTANPHGREHSALQAENRVNSHLYLDTRSGHDNIVPSWLDSFTQDRRNALIDEAMSRVEFRSESIICLPEASVRPT